MSTDKKNHATEEGAADELNVNDLETATADAGSAKAAKEPKQLTPEEIAGITAACEKITDFGVSENFAKVLSLVPVWHDKDASAPIKASVIESFGGSEAFKDYIDGAFQSELQVVNGLQKAVSTMNNIKSFYARRASSAKAKMVQVNIAGDLYEVNSDYLASLTGMDASDKRSALLAHADTKKNEALEVL
jgi:hypothetical protein